MSETTESPVIRRPRKEPADDLEGDLSFSLSAYGDRLWRVFTSMRTALVLILLLTLIAFIGTLLMQVPSVELQRDPQAYATWLETLRPKYGGWVVVLDKLQLLSIFNSVWFKLVLVLLTTSLLTCSVNRFRGLWRTATHPRTKMTPVFYDRAPHSANLKVAMEPAAVAPRIRAAFGARHYRTVVEADGDDIHVYADRFRWAPFGTLVAHLSIVFIFGAALLGQALGFRDSSFAAPIGRRVEVGYGTGLAIEAKSFTDTYSTQNGAPTDYASDLVLYKNGVQVAAQTIRVNEPLTYEGVAVYQSYYGPEAEMVVADSSGKTVFDGGVPLQWGSTDKNRRIGTFDVPGANLSVYVVGVASGETDPQIKPGQMQLEVYPGEGQPSAALATRVVTQGEPAQLAGYTFTFSRERQFTGLIVARDPGTVLIWIGTTLLVVGSAMVFLFQQRRIWLLIRRTPGGSVVRLGTTTRHDAAFASDFRRLVDETQLAIDSPLER
jgi:ResB protein required for cytochrome c biosynthesis